MHEISGTTIVLKQGDTCRIKLNLVRRTERESSLFIPEEGSSIRLVAKRRLGDKPIDLESMVDLDTMTLEITSEQTKDLPLKGREMFLRYDLELTKPNGDIATLVSNAELIIVPEVD